MGGGLTAIALSEVVRRVDEHSRVSRPEWDSCQNGPYPMHGWDASPGEPQLADWDASGCDADDADHCFGGYFPGLGVFLVGVDHTAD